MPADLSVIIPVFNRGDLIRHTLARAPPAAAQRQVKTIVVDDGSTSPVANALDRLGFTPARLIRQENRGLFSARLNGLAAATGRHVLFLDSDDLVGPEKFSKQVAALDDTSADISYSDTAHCMLGESGPSTLEPDAPLPETDDSAEFNITIQPPPH